MSRTSLNANSASRSSSSQCNRAGAHNASTQWLNHEPMLRSQTCGLVLGLVLIHNSIVVLFKEEISGDCYCSLYLHICRMM